MNSNHFYIALVLLPGAAAQCTFELAPNPGSLSTQILGWALTLPVFLLIDRWLFNEQ